MAKKAAWAGDRVKIKARIQEKMANGTDGDAEWDELLTELDSMTKTSPENTKEKAKAAREQANAPKEAPQEGKRGRGRPRKNPEAPVSNKPDPTKNSMEKQLEKAAEIDVQRIARGDKEVVPREGPARMDKGESPAPTPKERAQEAVKEAKAKKTTPKKPRAPKRPTITRAPIEALDDLPDIFMGDLNSNPQIADLQRAGILPADADPLTGRSPSVEPIIEDVPTQAAPKAPRASARGKLGRLAGAGAKLGAARAALGRGLGIVGRGAGAAGAALGVRELAHYLAPQTSQNVEDAVLRNPTEYIQEAIAREKGKYGQAAAALRGGVNQQLSTPNPAIGDGDPKFIPRGLRDGVNNVLDTIHPYNAGNRLLALAQSDPQMESISRPLNAGIDRAKNANVVPQIPPGQIPRLSNFGRPGIPMPAAPAYVAPSLPEMPSFSNPFKRADVEPRMRFEANPGVDGTSPSPSPSPASPAIPPQVAQAVQAMQAVQSAAPRYKAGGSVNAKADIQATGIAKMDRAKERIEEAKEQAVAPTAAATVTEKISAASKRPSRVSANLLKTSPSRKQAEYMIGGMPKSFQEAMLGYDPTSVAGSVPEIDAPYPHMAPVDFGQSFQQAFSSPELTEQRTAFLKDRPSNLPVQEQTTQRKRNPLLRALMSLRRPY